MGQMLALAKLLATTPLLPEHLRGVKRGQVFTPYTQDQIESNAFLIVNQAMRWNVDPFALAAETYVVGGKLGYQGKLVAAMVNAKAGIVGNLFPTYEGEGNYRKVTIHGKFPHESKPRTITLALADARTDNSMWSKDPDQKLFYSGVVKWARRHSPGVIVGVMTDDDLDRMRLQQASATTQSVSQQLVDVLTAAPAPAIAAKEPEPAPVVVEAKVVPQETPASHTKAWWTAVVGQKTAVAELDGLLADLDSDDTIPGDVRSHAKTQISVARKSMGGAK